MPSYFTPWRRKIGVLTLGLACLFAAGWVRSLSVADIIGFELGNPPITIVSFNGEMLLIINRNSGMNRTRHSWPLWVTKDSFPSFESIVADGWTGKKIRMFGVFYATAEYSDIRQNNALTDVGIEYWLPVTALTFASAILLSNARQSKPPDDTFPAEIATKHF
jgi:hypothetical protein